jgi:hypothetical protein
MAKILCSISGIEFNTDHFNIGLFSREYSHPIFHINSQRLIELTPRWLDQSLTPTENYLLYIALFKSTGLMDFRVPAEYSPDIIPVIAQNMHHLVQMVEKILDATDARKQEILHLPTFVITPDTKHFLDSAEWIKIWHNNYKEYLDSYKTATLAQKINQKESILERHIKDRTKDISVYAHQLASWAALAGKFPDFDVDVSDLSAFKQTPTIKMSQYWQYIIKSCAKTESIWDIPQVDLDDLIEHCELNIDHGSIYAHTLMSLLRAGSERKKDFFDLGDFNIGANGTTFRILDASASIEDANKLAAIDSAPIEMPNEKDYPNKLAFIKAKLNFKLAQDYKNQQLIAQKIKDEGLGD